MRKSEDISDNFEKACEKALGLELSAADKSEIIESAVQATICATLLAILERLEDMSVDHVLKK